MMRVVPRVISVVIPLIMLAACGPSNKSSDRMETSQRYSLCPKTDDARLKLSEMTKRFAETHNARFISRGEDAQRELSGMQAKNALQDTGGKLIVLTIEEQDVFHFSFSNLGLKEKIALTVGFSDQAGGASPVVELMDQLGDFWIIQPVEGGVTDDPPC